MWEDVTQMASNNIEIQKSNKRRIPFWLKPTFFAKWLKPTVKAKTKHSWMSQFRFIGVWAIFIGIALLSMQFLNEEVPVCSDQPEWNQYNCVK